jgi:hypothetical protein
LKSHKHLALEEALAEFRGLLEERLASIDPDAPPAPDPLDGVTLNDEERRFFLAELLLRLACSDGERCANPACRRSGGCQQLRDLSYRRAGSAKTADGRPPGAAALRRAIWVWMNA